MEITIKDTNTSFMPAVTEKPIEHVANVDDKPKAVTISQQVVYSIEELQALAHAVKLQGGRIKETITLRNGAGISCVIEFPEERDSD